MEVLDLAAGTGVLTRPLAEMRAALPDGVRALDGVAEGIPLPDGSVDLVTVGQAFHWLDGDAALAEIHRVLRAGGRLAMLWNRRVHDDPVNEAIVAPHRGDTPAERTGAWRAAFERTELFGPLTMEEFFTEQELDADRLADRVASISFIASLAPEERARATDAARALAADGPVRVPYRTELYVCERIG